MNMYSKLASWSAAVTAAVLTGVCTTAWAANAVEPAPQQQQQPPKPRLGATPPMGWNSWEAFRRDFDEDSLKAEADAMVSTGLRDAGYTVFVIDGGWKPATRGPNNVLIEDPKKFPHGMKAVADYVHSKGLKFGLHQPAGIQDCPKLSPGSQNFEEQDAKLFAAWGVDFIKYDMCHYIHAEGTTTGAPDFDRFVVRKGERVVFETEAEATQNRLTGLVRAERRDACSGGWCATGIGYDNGAVIVPDVTVPEAGKYTLDVHVSYPYFGWSEDFFKSVTFYVSVNGGERQKVSLPYKMDMRYANGTTSLEVELKQGVNTIQFDNPTSQEEEVHKSYVKMANALNRSGRPIMFSLCGCARTWIWGEPLSHLHRTAFDVNDHWGEKTGNLMYILERHVPELEYTAREFWPDPDMLEVGHKGSIGRPKASKPQMSDTEYRSQFALWSIMNAPLFISMDLRQIDEQTKKILLAKDIIAVNQDPLGKPCHCVRAVGDVMVFTKPLTDGLALAILNRGAGPVEARVTPAELGRTAGRLELKDLWTGETSHVGADGVIQANVASHATVIYRVTEGEK